MKDASSCLALDIGRLCYLRGRVVLLPVQLYGSLGDTKDLPLLILVADTGHGLERASY